MAASDATPLPIKNQAYRITLPIFDADGDLVTGATGLDSEISKDGGSFVDCTNEATEIATSSGIYYLDLSSTEMNADTVVIIVKTSSSGAKTTPVILYPAESNDIPVSVSATSRATIVDEVWDEVLTGATHNVSQSAGRRLREHTGGIVLTGTAQAGTTNTITLASGASSTNGIYDPALIRIDVGTGAGQARLIIDYNGTSKIAVVDRDWRVAPDATSEYTIVAMPNLMSTNEGLAQGGTSTSITLNASASSVNDTYVGQTIVLRTGTGQDQSRLCTAYNGTTKVATVAQAWVTTPTSSSAYMMLPTGRALLVRAEAGSIEAASFAANALTASALATDAVSEIQAGLATAAALSTVSGLVDDLESRLTSGRAANLDNLDAAVSTRATPAQVNAEADTALADVGLTSTVTGRIDAAISSRLASAGYTTPPTAATVADAIWDEARADHTTAGTFGQGVASVQGNVTGSVASVGSAVTLTTGERDAVAAALLDLSNGVETGYTLRQALRLIAAAVAGELSGAATSTITIRNLPDTATRITATVDADGNRTAVTHSA